MIPLKLVPGEGMGEIVDFPRCPSVHRHVARYRDVFASVRFGSASKTRATQQFAAEITFQDFTQLARRNNWAIDDLAREFRGCFGRKPHDRGYESPSEFFARMFWDRPSPKSVIVYRPVIEKYVRRSVKSRWFSAP